MKKEHVKLTDEERATLTALLTKGSLKAERSSVLRAC